MMQSLLVLYDLFTTRALHSGCMLRNLLALSAGFFCLLTPPMRAQSTMEPVAVTDASRAASTVATPSAADSVQPDTGDPQNGSAASSPAPSTAVTASFFRRLVQSYHDDWYPAPQTGPDAPFRGDPAPVTNPPFPFTTWPMGGTVPIGYPSTTSYPLTTAIYGGKEGQWMKNANIQIYGWADLGMNISTSHNGPYANAPAAYDQAANTFTLDQL